MVLLGRTQYTETMEKQKMKQLLLLVGALFVVLVVVLNILVWRTTTLPVVEVHSPQSPLTALPTPPALHEDTPLPTLSPVTPIAPTPVPVPTPATPTPTPIAKPCIISGCSSQICGEEEMMSTCEYRAEYACYQNAACERQADGACGWTQTETLRACLQTSGLDMQL